MRVQGYVHIDLAEPAPKIIDGYWHEWIDGVWVNTGIKAEGTDGISVHLHIRYSPYASGAYMTSNPVQTGSERSRYIGLLRSEDPIASNDYTHYAWSLIAGIDGITPTIYYLLPITTEIHVDKNGVYSPSRISCSLVRNDQDGYAIINSTPSGYKVWRQIDGGNSSTYTLGSDIDASLISKSISFRIERTASPSLVIDRKDIKVIRDGKNGDDGTSSYTHFRYSQNADGNPMSESPTNARYIGVSVTSTPVAPTNYGLYKWSEIKGSDGNGFAIRYIRANNRPSKPANGVLNPPGWMTEIDNPINNDIYWPSFIGKWTKQANGEYKSAPIGHNENSPLRFQFYNRTAGSDLRIKVRTSSESHDKVYIGKLDEELGEDYSNSRLNFGGTQSQDLVYALPYKGEHYIQFDYKKDVSVSTGDDAAYVKIDLPIQSVWMTITNVVNGEAQEWSVPSLFIDSRIEETIASADRSKAVTDKFGTTQEGGLIQTVMMLLREYNSQIVTAGISGIQGINRNHPAFWAGGTSADAIAFIEFLDAYENEIPPAQFNYKEKYDALAKIIFLHNGAAKVGDFIVRQNGTIMMIDPELGIQRLVFTASNLPLITDLVGGLNSSGGMDVGNGYLSGATSSSVTLSGSTNVTKAGAEVTFSGATISLSGSGTVERNGMAGYIEVGLRLYIDNVPNNYLGGAVIHFTSPIGQDTLESDVRNIPPMKFTLNKAGVVTFKLESISIPFLNSRLTSASITASRLDWKHVVQGVRRLQIGRDGIMAVYSNNHTHISENGGVDIRGKTNMPGVLLSGTVLSGGGGENFWGAKQSGTQPRKDSTGRYTIHHTIGHNRYSVSVLPKSANRSCHIVSQSNTDFVVEFRTIGSSPALTDTAFTIQVTGDNYS